jgi:hypothetical protein
MSRRGRCAVRGCRASRGAAEAKCRGEDATSDQGPARGGPSPPRAHRWAREGRIGSGCVRWVEASFQHAFSFSLITRGVPAYAQLCARKVRTGWTIAVEEVGRWRTVPLRAATVALRTPLAPPC